MRVGVVGVGNMGEHHVRVYSGLEGCKVVGVADINFAQAKTVADKYNTTAFDSIEPLLNSNLDAVSIVVPTSLHKDVATRFLEKGISCLVEKPIASNREEAKALISIAEEKGATLMVGHIERFNPAVLKLKKVVKAGRLGKILMLNARRVGPFAPRIRDVGIIIDLATHDIDVIRYLTEQEPRNVKSISGNFKHTKEDYAIIIMEFVQTIASIEVNWYTPVKTRTLIATGTEGMATLNYIDQTVELYDSKGKTGVEVMKEEPLKVELSHFLDCVRERKKPLVDGNEGWMNLKVALAALRSGVR